MIKQLFISFIVTLGCSQSILAMDPAAPEPVILDAKTQKLNAELICAAENDMEYDCGHLLDKGAQVEATNSKGWTVLMCAADRDRRSICKLLLARGANVNAKTNPENWTALEIAASHGNLALCATLIDHGADSSISLFKAVTRNNSESIQTLLALNAPVNTKITKNGLEGTPLLAAAHRDHEANCKLLIDHGAQLNVRSLFDKTALSWAAQRGAESVCSTLITYANFNPFLLQSEFRASRERIFTALCALRQACSNLPKDLKKKIFCDYNPALKQDFMNSAACGLYRNINFEQAPLLPLQIVRLLIHNGILNGDVAVAAIKAHHIACIKPLMLEAIMDAQTDPMRLLLNPNMLEKNFGAEIEQTIKKRLGLLTSCVMQ